MDFTSGKESQNLKSIRTLVSHLKDLDDSGKALQNSNFQLWNKIANTGLEQIGDPRITRFGMAADAVATELASVFKGSGQAPTDQETREWRRNLSNTMAPEQIGESVKEAIRLMSGRLTAIKDKYQAAMGKPYEFQVLYPKQREILSKMGVNPSDVEDNTTPTPNASNGINQGLQNQQIKQLDASTAQQLLQEAGGDKERARNLARQRGYTF
jgi:hypothetical protein